MHHSTWPQAGSTFNNATANNGAQLTGITFEEFKKNIGLFKTPTGVFFVNPNLLNITDSVHDRQGYRSDT